MNATLLTTIVGTALSLGVAIIGAIAGLRKKREQERLEAERRQREHEARLKSIERMCSNGNNSNVNTCYPQYLAQPTQYAMPQQSTITVNHYLHTGRPGYSQPIPQTQQMPMQTFNQPPYPQMNYNYGYGYGGGYNEPVWPAERIYGRGGRYDTPIDSNDLHRMNYSYAYA